MKGNGEHGAAELLHALALEADEEDDDAGHRDEMEEDERSRPQETE
jgi:hypothetical protein